MTHTFPGGSYWLPQTVVGHESAMYFFTCSTSTVASVLSVLPILQVVEFLILEHTNTSGYGASGCDFESGTRHCSVDP